MKYEHDGCKGCAFDDFSGTEKPCCDCKGTKIPFSSEYVEAKDYWVPCDGFEADDVVNHPSHYTQGSIECIDAMESAFGAHETAVYCKIAAFKYIWRCEHKNGLEDVKKAIWYLNKFLELEGGIDDTV